MTPTQQSIVNRHLAEKVCGWHELPWRLDLHDDPPHWCTCKDGKHRGRIAHNENIVADWLPCTNPSHAAMVRERMVASDWRFVLSSGSRGGDLSVHRVPFYLAQFMKLAAIEPYEAPTESEASSVAAFLATGGRLEE